MSLPIDKTLAWLRICSVPIFLIVSSVPAIWSAFTSEISFGPPAPSIPQLKIDIDKITDPLAIKRQPDRAAEILRNPFQPLQKNRPGHEGVNLHSINLELVIISSHKRLCRINGRMMKEGDKTDFFKLEKITKNGVWYTTRTGKYFLRTGDRRPVDDPGILPTEKKPIRDTRNQT